MWLGHAAGSHDRSASAATLRSLQTTKSSVAHATSASPVGPYVLPPGNDSQLVVPPWSHGAYIVQDPPSQQFLLWHLGDGSISPSGWAPCYDSNQTTPEAAAAAVAGKPVEVAVPGSYRSAPPPPGQRQAFVQTSSSLLGPWTAWNNDTGVYVTFPPGSWCSSIDNPAPFIFENGTTLLYFRSETCPAGWGALAPACIGVARADTWQGPYESLFVNPITHPEGEDPAVWRDPRGNFHMCGFPCLPEPSTSPIPPPSRSARAGSPTSTRITRAAPRVCPAAATPGHTTD